VELVTGKPNMLKGISRPEGDKVVILGGENSVLEWSGAAVSSADTGEIWFD
jgi:phosphoribosylformylglycinamidine (FGAM) synthase-like enzyme